MSTLSFNGSVKKIIVTNDKIIINGNTVLLEGAQISIIINGNVNNMKIISK